MSLSIFIICKNEEGIIGECLKQSQKLLDKIDSPNSEIVLVDSGSTDRTLEIAKAYTESIHHQDWLGYAQQKNYALSLCKNEWVLSLDADEVLTDASIDEIYNTLTSLLKPSNDFAQEELDELKKIGGFKIPRKLFIGQKFIRWGGYFPDYQLRVFRKDLGQFKQAKVHESVELDAKYEVINLRNPLDHYSYENIGELRNAFDKYADLGNQSLAQNKKGNLLASLKFLYTFIYKLFIRPRFSTWAIRF